MFQNLNQQHMDEIQLVKKELSALIKETESSALATDIFLNKSAAFIEWMFQLEEELTDDYFTSKTFEELLELNHSYYKDIDEDHYEFCYGNPNYSVKIFGKEFGQLLSSIYAEIRQCLGYAFEHRLVDMMLQGQKLLLLASFIQSKEVKEIKYVELISNLRKFNLDHLEKVLSGNIYRKFSPEFDVYSSILSLDLSDNRYIFRYGMYISYNEIELVKYFASCSDEKIKDMADTYTEAFNRGFERNGVDLTKKGTVNVGYHIGFEPVIYQALKNFDALGLKPLIFYELKGTPRPRIMNTKPNKQFEYDHRFDDGLYLSEEYINKTLEISEKVFEQYKDMIALMAGPAVMEVFGELPFSPSDCENAVKYNEEMTALKNKYTSEYQQLFNRYLPRSEYSFVLISFPVPEIGEDFKAIFDETIIVNTLDEAKYMEIQQKIIDALDLGESATITGRKGNKTNLTIMFNEKVDVTKQTNFNNCTADVNVPVGEVFTSPKLTGTNGKLHVKEVYLHGLKYENLEIDFEGGYISNYICSNFKDEDKNKAYVHENMMHPHKTLPLGEFAIGTNTTAYVMAKKYNIEKIIPILIGEKMGPHFAIGDTCYTWSEDVAVFNPDGREIVARENEKTCQRVDSPSDAYTYKHTDITIPYSELDKITVNKKDGTKVDIISEGRFVLPGTEALNEPLKDIEV